MGPGIVIPIVVVAVAVPALWTLARKYLKEGPARPSDASTAAASARLTSEALMRLPRPTWRVVHEIAEDKLNGVSHVLIGPPGVYAVQTSMDPLPTVASDTGPAPAEAVADVAIVRGALDDLLVRCAMSTERLVTVHWGKTADGTPIAVDPLPGATAVEGRSLETWAQRLLDDVRRDPDRPELVPSGIDLAWQTVTTGIGRPDPLA